MSDPGSIIAAFGKIIGGVQANEMGKHNARVAEANAQESLRGGVMEAAMLRERARRARGQQAAAQAAGGFEIGMGSARRALEESAINEELDALMIGRSAMTRARGYRMQGNAAKVAGRNAMTGGFYGAAAEIQSGMGAFAAVDEQTGYGGGG
ncbi:hypothetical protein ACSMXM_01350 [Pacificimonas sp. ICDLI1SI03]